MSSEPLLIAKQVPTAGPDPFEPSHLCRYFSDQSPQPMVAVEGPTHIIRYLNPAFAHLVAKPSGELIGRPFAEAIPEGESNGCLALLDSVFQTGLPRNLVEQEHRQTPLTYWSYAMWAILGADERPAGVMIQVTEATETVAFHRQAAAITEALVVSAVRQHELIDTIQRGEREKRELELQMFQAQKLESLGVLAGGIAHDLNNMLTPVIGYAEVASKSLPEGSPLLPMLGAVVESARRAADLVQQILAYAGKGRFVIQSVDLSRLVQEMQLLLSSAVRINTELVYDLAPALPPVNADATQLRQVVMNLVTNASEAIDAIGGTVSVRTGLILADQQKLHASSPESDWARGAAVFLEVEDSGCGMTADLIEKIFDPFFSTKFTGRGLGLAVVHGIARGHDGAVQVRSEPGRGSTFRLLLPCSPTTAAAPVVQRRPEDWRGSGFVLVIDDDKVVRDITGRILKMAGLTVLGAEDGQAGLKVFREQQRIDAVVLDLTMPGMGGLEVARALRGTRPDLPIILMSGFSVLEPTLHSADLGITGFVQKPFKPVELLAAVRQALGR